MTAEHIDVLIIGAGISGVGAACHLTMHSPKKRFAILEAREDVGGTWDLFQYPGIRSDSDMYTFGYNFRPWLAPKSIAEGGSIKAYVRDTAEAYGVAEKIRFGHKVKSISWSSEDARWTVRAEAGGKAVTLTCDFIFACTGYYDYAQGHAPDFPGAKDFKGALVHPQHWPRDLDYAGKQVVVIGSGATAVTIVPVMAETAGHVTMLQRSPSYVVSRPAQDAMANWLKKRLPTRMAYGLIRWRNVLLGLYFFNQFRTRPERSKTQLIGMVKQQLGDDYDVETHFTPRYNPWDQRLCLVPDADLFKAIKSGAAEVVTDEIETFTGDGIKLKSGRELAADIIVSATGLKLQMLGGVDVEVDGARVEFAKTMQYKGVMFSDIPNLASVFGYTNASWTLKADLTSEYICRLLNYMDAHGYDVCAPHRDPAVTEEPFLDFSSGYVQRAIHTFPRQGSEKPWRLNQNYVKDMMILRYGKVNDGVMRFHRKNANAEHEAA